MLKNKRIVIAICCLLSAAIVAGAFVFAMRIDLGSKSNVVVVTRNIAKGEKITEANVQLLKRTADEVSEYACTDLKQVVGTYAVSTLYANDVLTPSKLSSTPVNGDNLITAMASDKIALSVPVEGAKGVNGKLESGDIVQVFIKNPEYELAKTAEEKLSIDRYILNDNIQYMKVLSITFSDFTEAQTKEDGGTYTVVTFECSVWEAEKLLTASEYGLHLAFVCHGDDPEAQKWLDAQAALDPTRGSEPAAPAVPAAPAETPTETNTEVPAE